ncbi:UNVERIFIED_CONTAM: hypothetical protein RMT77_001627 [Armadillidium vulgare]
MQQLLKPILLLGLFIAVSGRVLLPHEVSNHEVRSHILNPPNKKGAYNWGYIYPKRSHVEQRNQEGVVTGIVSFVNPYGNVVQWQYTADPQLGYKVTEYKESPPASQSFGIANPIVKNAEAIGYIKPFSYEQDRNQVRYSIDNSVAAAAGSESQLAANLDAIPVAAVHDARAPPSRSVASEQRSPVLVSKDADAEFGNSEYFLVVPTV